MCLRRSLPNYQMMLEPDVLTTATLIPDLINTDFLEPIHDLITDDEYTGKV